MRTLKYQSPEKQKSIAQETLEIYAPIANRLGISKVKWDLEDLCLRYLEPEKFYELVERISMKRDEREEYIQEIIDRLHQELDKVGIQADISGLSLIHILSVERICEFWLCPRARAAKIWGL